MISHGFVSGAMFLCIGVLYDRVHSREIAAYGGVVNTMPKFAAFAVLFAMANCGLPGTAGFVGEWMVILGAVKFNFWIARARRDDADLGRRLHAVDGQARLLRRRSPTSMSRELADLDRREFAMLAAARDRGAVDGPLSEAVHRRHAHVGRSSCCEHVVASRKMAPEAHRTNHELASRLTRPAPRSRCW